MRSSVLIFVSFLVVVTFGVTGLLCGRFFFTVRSFIRLAWVEAGGRLGGKVGRGWWFCLFTCGFGFGLSRR